MSPSVCNGSQSVVNPALIMIPDISGFTEYMNDADLPHSQLRIASLLEAILESNVLEFNVSEIEGDAILFYSFNNTSALSEIIGQCKLMFERFHQKLKEFEVSGCQCGSCQRLQKLTLKFILHFGQLGSVMVKDYCKLYGRDLIIAHRLLKNDLPLREYILFTQSFVNEYHQHDFASGVDWFEWRSDHQYIPDIRRVDFHYIDLRSMMDTTIIAKAETLK